ncbi:MAG: transcriptional repressor LexA [Desulfobacteraceae bacterium]|nr:transcriptional repressor LexA [Desulfobacteraceae bacterium]
MDFNDLTERQQQILAYIIEYQKRYAISPTVREIAKHFKLTSPGSIHRMLNVLKDRGYLHADALKKRSWRTTSAVPMVGGIAVVGAIAAGDPIEAVQHVEEELGISPSVFGCEQCFALKVKGDSMIEAHIKNGDLAIIRRQARVANGEIAAVMVEDILPEATLKIFQKSETAITLKPANRGYKPLTIRGQARKGVKIIGKLVGVVRRT